MSLPFDGAISNFLTEEAPDTIRKRVENANKKDMIDPGFPYESRMKKGDYKDAMERLQIELVKMQSWVNKTGARVVIVFEGRDAAGKGGTIKRFRENLNPRIARVVALAKPSDREMGEWYFQRYIRQLPAAGEIVFFDRSWYNRGVVEPVFGFCTEAERELFYKQVPAFEQMLVDEGIHLVKFWLNVGRGEQLRRFLKREADPLKQWKLSPIDVRGLAKWDAYSNAIERTLDESHSDHAPWTIVRTDDKRRARLAAIRRVLLSLDYDHKDVDAIGTLDAQISGGPEIWSL